MLKRLIIYIPVLISLLFSQAGVQAQVVRYTTVEMPSAHKNTYIGMFDMKLLAEDLAQLLSVATSKKYVTSETEPNAQVHLLLDRNFSHPSNEAGTVEYKNGTVVITAKYASGISFAAYSWLEKLGFRFSLPGNEWTTVPVLQNLKLKENTFTFFPHFRLRTMFASGGMPSVKGLDEERRNEKEWWLWYRRNKMGSDYIKIGGHIGELFNIIHKKEIMEDPTILAPVNGKRQYSVGGKLDPTNAKGVKMFSDWIVREYKKEQAGMPGFLPHKKYYTVDPGDGLEYCHTPECEKMFASVSDQVFTVANITAKKIKNEDPRAGVSIMAYTERADTPTIKIEPNVHVMVVPTAFQSVSTSTELMQRWKKKTPNISQYDFLNIGVWAVDQPFFDMNQYINRLNYLHTLQIEGMSFETSMSKFASGIQQYFILKFLSEPYRSADSLLKEYCAANFGNAAQPIEKLFREWYFNDVHLNTNRDKESFQPDELARFLHYIKIVEASRNTKLVRQRISQLKAYVVYLCKFYELFQAPERHIDQKQKADSLLNYSWSLYNKGILHNTQLNDMLKKYSTDPASRDYRKMDHSRYRSTDAEVNKLFSKYLVKYPLIADDLRAGDSLLNTLIKLSADSIHIRSMDEEAFGKFVYPVRFYSAGSSVLKIKYRSGKSPSPHKEKIAILACESDDYSFIDSRFLYQQDTYGEVSFNIPARGNYRLYLSYFKSTPVEYVIIPGKQIFYLHKKSILMNGFLLHSEQKEAYPNKAVIGFIAPEKIVLGYPYRTSITPVRLFSLSGKPLNVIKKTPFLEASARNEKLLYYTNEVYRWPPFLYNSPPYFFFLKKQ